LNFGFKISTLEKEMMRTAWSSQSETYACKFSQFLRSRRYDQVVASLSLMGTNSKGEYIGSQSI
jgi:hypothetical protein